MDGFIIVEDVSNFSGGIKNGSVFNGVLHSIVNYNFLNSPSNSSIHIGVLAITYNQSQTLYTGASQQVSNMTAQREIRLAELNYCQNLSDWATLRAGIMDIREYLNVYDIPKEVINSGFGTNRVMVNSTAVATYPYPGFGAVLATTNDKYGISVAVFQGNPQHQSTVFNDGVFLLEEVYWNTDLNIARQPTLFLKTGVWEYYQPDPSIGYSNIGMYFMGQIVAYTEKQQQIYMTTQIGYGNNHANIVPYSLNASITGTGFIPSRNNDKLSFGYSQIWLRNKSPEIVLEINYNFYIRDYLYVKPDLQYIVKPNGNLPNAFAGILRLIYNINGHLLAKH